MLLLSNSLISTSSGSFLLSRTQITSLHAITCPVFEASPLAEPNWALIDSMELQSTYQSQSTLEEGSAQLTSALQLGQCQIHIHDGILEGTHAQMVIQKMYLDKLNVSLKGVEKTDQTKLFPDEKGWHLTNKTFIAVLEASKMAHEGEEAAKRSGRRGAWV
jgi:hypothetical protein